MKPLHVYLTLFPNEALIASHLPPESFGVYMATGIRRASSEPIVFVELQGDLKAGGIPVDRAEARIRNLPADVTKNSIYLSVYRCLEQVSLALLGTLYLVTRDGRSLTLSRGETVPSPPERSIHLYQELCPVRPLVASTLDPVGFCKHMTDPASEIHLPKIAVADLKVLDPMKLEDAGNIGSLYYAAAPEHMRDCFHSLLHIPDKVSKVVARFRLESFSYQLIESGIHIASASQHVFYPMLSTEEIRSNHRDWGKSALIL